LYFFVCIGFF
jgi:glutamyl/glutaminyl-tRNA synthetase